MGDLVFSRLFYEQQRDTEISSPSLVRSSSYWRFSRLELTQTQHSSRTDQRKTLTFTGSIVHIPQHPILSHIWCSMLGSSCFPSSIKHYRDQKNPPSLAAATPQSWNNPFLVKPNQSSYFQAGSNVQYTISSVSPCSESLCENVGKGEGKKKEWGSLCFYSTELPLYTIHSKEHSSWKSAKTVSPHFAFMYSPDQFIKFPTSSSDISKGTSCQWTVGQLNIHIGM